MSVMAEASPAELVAAVREWLDGGQRRGDTVHDLAERLGVPPARIFAIMRVIFEIADGYHRRPMVVPDRYR